MGQRLLVRSERRGRSKPKVSRAIGAAALAVFHSELGWLGLVGSGEVVTCLLLGHASAEEVRRAAARAIEPPATDPLPERDWNPKVRRKIQDFVRGIPTDFDDVAVDLGPTTPFRKRVLQLTRAIGYGRTTTYGELAARAGNPRAARAIGAVMASNRIPFIIPCHRVVASGGSIGGFSAPQGIELKRRLLEMEAALGGRRYNEPVIDS